MRAGLPKDMRLTVRAVAGESSPLTLRELEVVKCAARGKTNKVIASELSLSEHTVKNYLFRAFEKLGVSNRVELLFYLTSRGHTFGAVRADDPEPDLKSRLIGHRKTCLKARADVNPGLEWRPRRTRALFG